MHLISNNVQHTAKELTGIFVLVFCSFHVITVIHCKMVFIFNALILTEYRGSEVTEGKLQSVIDYIKYE